MTAKDPYKIRVLRETSCPDNNTCFIAGTVPARPGKVQIVGRVVDDPQLIGAYAYKIGPGEALFEIEQHEWEG